MANNSGVWLAGVFRINGSAVLGSLLLIMCAFNPRALAQQTSYPCEASPIVAQALASLPDGDDTSLTWAQRVGPVRALLKQYPDDLFVQLRYQDMILGNHWMAEEFDSALASNRSMPDKNLSQYLEARLLWHSQLRKSRETLNHLVETVPQFPWPHLALVEITEFPGNAGSAGAEEHLRAFLNACPNALEAYAHFGNVKDPEMIRSGAVHLRQLLSARTDATVWRYSPSLWELEFRAAPKEEHDKVRERVRDDVKRLELLPPIASNSWDFTFSQAARLAEDPSIQKWLNDTILTKLPNSSFAMSMAEERWIEEHPRPSSPKGDDYRKWDEQHFEATAEWLKRWPNSPYLVTQQWTGVMILPDLSTETVLAIVDKYTEMLDDRPDWGTSSPPFPIIAAEEYVKHKVRLDRVPAMIEAGVRQAEMQKKYQIDPELLPPEFRRRRNDAVSFARYRGGIILADLYLFTKETSKAQEVLMQAATDLEAQKPPQPLSAREESQYKYERGEYLKRLARLEEMEGKNQDALADYQEILQQLPRRIVEAEKLDYVRDAKQLYLKQGGKPENWLQWAASPQKPTHAQSALSFSAPIPDFAVTDVAGRQWRLSDLKGKVTLLDVWATWCGACSAELPFIQKLYDQIKDRKDLQVVTISVDDNPGLIEALLKEKHFTFPILPAKDLAAKIFPVIMLPQTWIVDPAGQRSQDEVVGASDEWVTRTIAQMERVRGETH